MAPNEIMGEVEFTVDGARYVLAFNYFARLQIRRNTGKSFRQYLAGIDPKNFGELELFDLYTAGLCQRHELDEKGICALLESLGNERSQELVVEAMKLAFPNMVEVAKSTANFPTVSPTNGTGLSSNG